MPFGSLTFDPFGNLYGATLDGGANGHGAIFELMPSSGRVWSYAVLYSFQSGGDGEGPTGDLVFDSSGNLYGTTAAGGMYGTGTAFELSPSEDDRWAETVLYSFGAQAGDGLRPQAGLVFDTSGNLYGAAYSGGIVSAPCPDLGCGAVFELSPSLGGGWTESVLYSFQGGSDGEDPLATLILDSLGNLYGTTHQGGGSGCNDNPYLGCGTVFKLSPSAAGWTETILHAFDGRQDGAGPVGGLIFDSLGNLYGTAEGGGIYGLGECDGIGRGGCGVAFELSPNGGGWTESVLHSFRRSNGGRNQDGSRPYSSLAFDSVGRLYGTTSRGGGGDSIGSGTVFRLTPSTSGKWTEERFAFRSQAQGYAPQAAVTLDSSGNVYGVTTDGGAGGGGVIFEIIPSN
jgi:uncharacterized repeat protein (TIGR03803 family)